MTITRKVLKKTAIEWTDYSWNPIRARDLETGKVGWHCEHASRECLFCYAETINRVYGTGLTYTHRNTRRVEIFLDESWLNARMPREPARIFVCDMTDLFGSFVRNEHTAAVLDVIRQYPQHTFQILTKRPDRMCAFGLPANVWAGTSIGERRAILRLDHLHQVGATVRFVSFEPLLEGLGALDLGGIDWAIAGAESDGWSRARTMDLDWVRSIRDQCIAQRVAFFFKQNVTNKGRTKLPLPELDGRRWRQFPAQRECEQLYAAAVQ